MGSKVVCFYSFSLTDQNYSICFFITFNKVKLKTNNSIACYFEKLNLFLTKNKNKFLIVKNRFNQKIKHLTVI